MSLRRMGTFMLVAGLLLDLVELLDLKKGPTSPLVWLEFGCGLVLVVCGLIVRRTDDQP